MYTVGNGPLVTKRFARLPVNTKKYSIHIYDIFERFSKKKKRKKNEMLQYKTPYTAGSYVGTLNIYIGTHANAVHIIIIGCVPYNIINSGPRVYTIIL